MSLTHLTIRDIILVKKVDIQVGSGLCVLTGETGAGKSILLDAFGFVLGERANTRLIRQGAEKASVSASFDVKSVSSLSDILEESDIQWEDSEELVLRRTIDTQGKSKAFVNDQVVSISLLKRIGELLVEVHGQHDQKGLLDHKTNRRVLDQYGQLVSLQKQVADLYTAYQTVKLKQENLIELQKKAAQEEDYLRYVYNELDKLDLTINEEALAQKRQRLMNKEKMIGSLNDAYHVLTEQALAKQLINAQQHLNKLTSLEPKIVPLLQALERAVIEVSEVESQLQNLLGEEESEEDSLESIEQLLFALRAVARKHQVEVSELSKVKTAIQEKLEAITNHESVMANLAIELANKKQAYLKKATELSSERQKSAQHLETKIHAELADLKMGGTIFKVGFEPLTEEQWSADGIDKIIFLASTNPGSPLSPLSTIASGGELSRFMLALKVSLSHVKSTPTLIFDEIDTGIGGATADAVGKRLQLLGKDLQVLVVTHQPQVASKGQTHLKITKTQENGETITQMEILNKQERQEEIARMLAGEDITNEARAAAAKLLI